jgi:MYXO-CTERM domain-containing protein
MARKWRADCFRPPVQEERFMKIETSGRCRSLFAAGALALGLSGGANATIYSGVWDPSFGPPFTSPDIGWRSPGVTLFVDDTCNAIGTATTGTVYLSTGGCGGSQLTAGVVEFYYADLSSTDTWQIDFFAVNPAPVLVDTLKFVNGVLSGLAFPTGVERAAGVVPSNVVTTPMGIDGYDFALYFNIDAGPRLVSISCVGDPLCRQESSVPAELVLTQVAEPTSLALVPLALAALAATRRRRPKTA